MNEKFSDCKVGDIVYVSDRVLTDCEVGIATVVETDGSAIKIDFNGVQYEADSLADLNFESCVFSASGKSGVAVYADYEYFALIMKKNSEKYQQYYKYYTNANIVASTIEYFSNMQPFKSEEDIPDIPRIKTKDVYEKIIIPNIIRCGGIPKARLEVGKEYIGSCRNSNRGTWNGEKFEIKRFKWGSRFDDTVEHFEDDTIFDVFVPLREAKEIN